MFFALQPETLAPGAHDPLRQRQISKRFEFRLLYFQWSFLPCSHIKRQKRPSFAEKRVMVVPGRGFMKSCIFMHDDSSFRLFQEMSRIC